MSTLSTRVLSAFLLAALPFVGASAEGTKTEKPVPPALNFTVKSISGEDVSLAKYAGKAVLIVNTASKCGHTPQYKELEALHQKYKDKGLAVLGFPANDFKNQEPGSDQQIAEFCEKNYGVTFDMFSKVNVKGPEQAPLYKYLTDPKTDAKFPGDVKWNFEKFLIGKDGQIAGRFLSAVKPSSDVVVHAVEAELAK